MPRVKDPVGSYAARVLSGRIVAGPHVRNACRRHLADLKDAPKRGLYFDYVAALDAIDFFPAVLCLAGGQFEGLPFELDPSQAFIIGSIFGWKRDDGTRRFRRAYIEEGKGNGKALALDTPIPTPFGWSYMDELSVGDQVLDEAGLPCRVTAVTPVMQGRPCYRVEFDDRSEIVADEEHLWETTRHRRGRALRTTGEIAATLRRSNGRYQTANHAVALAGALQLPAADLPIPPYVLGAWLGDGDSDCARLTCAFTDAEILEQIAAEGVTVSERNRQSATTGRFLLGSGGRSQAARDRSMQADLRRLGVLGNKHIPITYLRASREQRADLLAGLLDTDGSITDGGQVELTQTSRRLAEDAVELIASLGFKPTKTESAAVLNGVEVGRRYRIQFWPRRPVFRLSRKNDRTPGPARQPFAGRRLIVGCEPIESVPVRCISVDSPSRMYLAGRSMIPTHNSPLAAGIGLYCLIADGENRAEIYAAASKKEQAQIMFRDAVAMYEQSPGLQERLIASGANPIYNLADPLTGSFFRPIASAQRVASGGVTGGQSGPRPSCALCDEVHEHRDGTVIEMLERGFKWRVQPLLVMITNSGSDPNSVCGQEHAFAVKVAAGTMSPDKSDSAFSYVCALDEARTEVFHYRQAMRYMENSCSCERVPTILIDRLKREVFAHHAISDGIRTTAPSGAKITPTGPSKPQGSVPPAMTGSIVVDPLKPSTKSAKPSGGGTRKTSSTAESTSDAGLMLDLDTDWQNLSTRLCANAACPMRNSARSSKGSTAAAPSAAKNRNISASITTTRQGCIGACSASSATRELVFSEILSKVWNAHSPTCEVRSQSRVEKASLRIEVPADDPLTDPRCWVKANPLLGDPRKGKILTRQYLADVVSQALAIPGKLNNILRLHFCVWTDAERAWMPRGTLERCIVPFETAADMRAAISAHEGASVSVGVDLSAAQDLTIEAFAVQTGTVNVERINKDGSVSLVEAPTFDAWIEGWSPGDTLEQRAIRDSAPYDLWAKHGWLNAPSGLQIRMDYPAAHLADVSTRMRIRRVAYDRYAYRRFEEELDALNFEAPMVEHPQGGKRRGAPPDDAEEGVQGLWMPGSVMELESLILERRIRLFGNPVLVSACAAAVFEEDPFGNRWFSKRRATGRIDALVALAMAVGAAMLGPGDPEYTMFFLGAA